MPLRSCHLGRCSFKNLLVCPLVSSQGSGQWGGALPCLGSFGLQEPRPIDQKSVSLLPGWLFALLTSRACVFGSTHPLQTASPGPACGTRARLRHQAPPVASHFSRGKCSPTRPPHGPDGSFEGGSWEASQDCPESKHLRTQFGLVRRLAATKGHCEGCLSSRRDPFSSPRMGLAC